MFTGIVQAVGRIVQCQALGQATQAGKRLVIAAPGLDLSNVKLVDSIAPNGAFMTVVEKTHDTFSVDVSAESLSKTAVLDQVGTDLNLE